MSTTSGYGDAWAAAGFRNWTLDDKEPNCPVCGELFTMTYRRHHCRVCGGLVCDACSPHRLPLPNNPQVGKVRVCNSCAATVGEGHAVNAQEELQVNAQIVRTIQAALKGMHEELSEGKLAMLEIEAAAFEDRTALDEFLRDPEGNASAFGIILSRLHAKWASMGQEFHDAEEHERDLRQRLDEERGRLEAADSAREELLQRKAEADRRHEELDQLRKRRDELIREKQELEAAVADCRNEVSLLELEQESRQARQSQRWDRVRQCFGQSLPPPPRASLSPQDSFTVSTGRLPLTASVAAEGDAAGGVVGRDRLEGCRRSCALM